MSKEICAECRHAMPLSDSGMPLGWYWWCNTSTYRHRVTGKKLWERCRWAHGKPACQYAEGTPMRWHSSSRWWWPPSWGKGHWEYAEKQD